jgi:hypothetical protein
MRTRNPGFLPEPTRNKLDSSEHFKYEISRPNLKKILGHSRNLLLELLAIFTIHLRSKHGQNNCCPVTAGGYCVKKLRGAVAASTLNFAGISQSRQALRHTCVQHY